MAAPGEIGKEQLQGRQSSSQQRLVQTIFVLCCCCSLLLVLPICWKVMKASFGLSSSLAYIQDFAADPSFGDKSELETSVRNSTTTMPEGEKYMWYSPHGGFSNQARELMNALKLAFLLNRTLVLPPVLDHFEVLQGSCLHPLVDQRDLRKLAWAAITGRFNSSATQGYVSIGDIIDLSSIKSTVKTIDLRIFLAMWCGIDISPTCFGPVCHSLALLLQSSPPESISSCAAKFFSSEQGHKGPNLIHEVHDSCVTTIWTAGESFSEKVHMEQLLKQQLDNDATLHSNINASSIHIERKDVIETLGPASTAGGSFLLAFGTMFSRAYGDSTLVVDIPAPPHGDSKARILREIARQTFSMDILDAGRYFVQKKMVEPFFCAHVRLSDGLFKFDQERKIFRTLRQRLQQLETLTNNQTTSGQINLFVMTDLPGEKWPGTYLHDLQVNPKYKIHTLDGEGGLLNDVIQKIDSHEYGLIHGYLPQFKSRRNPGHSARFPGDQGKSNMHTFSGLVFVEEVVCSCATLGFQGTLVSTLSEHIKRLREAQECPV